MHVSLPEELKNMVKTRVDSGLYGSASEVVRAALRQFFHVSDESDISPAEAQYIRKIAAPRLDSLNKGTAETRDFDKVFDEIEENLK